MIVTHPKPTQAMPAYQPPAYQSYQQPSSNAYLGGQQNGSGWTKPPPPYAGAPPPVPPGMSVNPQQWQAGYWQYNPLWNKNQNSKQQHVPWIPSHHWMPQHNQQSSSSASQQQASHNPYKRVPRPPSAEYLATQLSDNPLGLSGLDEPNKNYDHVHTPWVWRPRDLEEEDQESPSQEHTSNDPLNHTRRSSESTNTTNSEYFTAKRELQPTFSVNIVRTPEHYRRHSSGSNPPTPSRNSSRESRTNSSDGPSPWNSMSPSNNGINGGSRDSVGGSPDSSGLSVPGPILGDQLSDEPASMLSPLIMSHTPKPGSSPLRSLRSHVTHPLIGSNLEPIPEATNLQNETKLKPKDRRPAPVTHSSSLPTMTSSQTYGGPHPSPHREGYEKERDRRDKEKRSGIGSKYTTAAFIEPRSIAPNTYNHNHPSSPASPSSHSTPSSRHSTSSLPSPTYSSSHATPPSSYSPRPSPPQRKSKSSPPEDIQYKAQLQAQSPQAPKPSDSSTLVLSKIPLPPPPSLQGNYAPIRPPSVQTYDNRRRRGYWNRRGDHLTDSGYIVHAPPHKLFPPELRNYPAEDEGYENHDGIFTSFILRPDLPESIPRNGKPAEVPYEHFVVYQSR